ncbi:barstar family protein [Actinoplanes sp. NPDC049802]|uniref:barstar family protein n=1 Tax=Actinoplanes sp. NPDC049802 TaxID=3154742 RepID=UPI0033C071D4
MRPRWLLEDEFSDDLPETEPSRPVGVCAEVDGLFADLPDPGLERFALVDCDPEPGLRGRLGEVCLEASLHGQAPHGTWLRDVTVAGAGDGRVELTGRVHAEHHLRPVRAMPAVSVDGFRLCLPDDTTLARCRAVEGVYRSRPELEPPSVRLIGFRPEPWFRELLADWRPGNLRITASLSGRAADGRALRTLEPGVFADVAAVRPSPLGPDLFDVDLDGGMVDPIPARARPLWDDWLEHRPTTPGTWRDLDTGMRHEWLRLALADHRHDIADRPAGTVYHLDGRHVTDVNGFYCALGEAVNGPGGYFGWNLDAVDDCLNGCWGATTPFRLEWSHFPVARTSLGGDEVDYLVDLLTERGRVEVVPVG